MHLRSLANSNGSTPSRTARPLVGGRRRRSGGVDRRRCRAAAAGAAAGAAAAAAGAAATADYDALAGLKVLRAGDGAEVELTSLWRPEPGARAAVVFLTHFGDLTTFELADKLRRRALAPLAAAGVPLITVGLGSPANARAFAAARGFPTEGLYADPSGACYKALGFSPGFAAGVEGVDPYLKLLPMLAGIGSPGTVQEVIRGYVGDRSAPPVLDGPLGRAFDVLGSGYQRPLELATHRLQNMAAVLSRWGELAPADTRLLTQQGGALVLDGKETLYRHADPGILKYADVDAILEAATRGRGGGGEGQQQQAAAAAGAAAASV